MRDHVVLGCVVLVLVLFLSGVILFYKHPLSHLMNDMIQETSLRSTHLLIYDKSTKKYCNRLIVVMPFEWYVWVNNNMCQVILLHSPVNCPENTVPLAQIYEEQNDITVKCGDINYQTIINLYTQHVTPRKLDYKITSERFNVADALNYLSQKGLIKTQKSPKTDLSDLPFNVVSQYKSSNLGDFSAMKEKLFARNKDVAKPVFKYYERIQKQKQNESSK